MEDIDTFLPHLTKRGLVLQAGGATGEYPAELARHFAQVITVEPNPSNFRQLGVAVAELPNVTTVYAGLWHEPGRADTKILRSHDLRTCYIVPGDTVDLITIDSLLAGKIPDLIWLDIQGSEHWALEGAKETLKGCNAVIIEEGDKRLELTVGDEIGSAKRLLESLGFVQRHAYRLDRLYIRE